MMRFFFAQNEPGPFHLLLLIYHFVYQFYSRIIALVQSSFHTTWASLFEIELEHELELEDMKRTLVGSGY